MSSQDLRPFPRMEFHPHCSISTFRLELPRDTFRLELPPGDTLVALLTSKMADLRRTRNLFEPVGHLEDFFRMMHTILNPVEFCASDKEDPMIGIISSVHHPSCEYNGVILEHPLDPNGEPISDDELDELMGKVEMRTTWNLSEVIAETLLVMDFVSPPTT